MNNNNTITSNVSTGTIEYIQEILTHIKKTFPDIPQYTSTDSIQDIMYHEGGRKVMFMIQDYIKEGNKSYGIQRTKEV